jgi:hypothetical protein
MSETPCKARHHHLLHLERHQTKASKGERPPAKPIGVVMDQTPTEEPGFAVQLALNGSAPREACPP